MREDGAGAGQLVELGRDLDLVGRPALVVAHGVGDLAQVAGAVAGDHRVALGLAGGDGGGALERPAVAELLGEAAHQPLVEGVDAVVVELAGDGGEDRQLLVGRAVEEGVGAAVLLAHVAQGVERHRPVELVDGHEVGVVEHVDLLELHGGAVLGGHDVEREIGDVDDLGVGLADAGALDDDQIEARRLADGDRVFDVLGEGAVGLAGGERAHEDAVGAEDVQSNPVAEEGAAGLSLGGVDREDGDGAVGVVGEEAEDQLVGERGLAGAAGAGDAEDRGGLCRASGSRPPCPLPPG